MTFYRIIFPLVDPCTSYSQPYADVPTFHLLSFAFWWCTFIWLLPTLFCVLLIFLSYFVFLLPPLHSGDIPTVPSSDFYLPSFAFWWCSYPILSSSLSLLHSGDVPTVPSFDFYLPSFAFSWSTYPCFCFSSVFPHYLAKKPISYTLYPTCKSFLAQWWRTYTLVPSSWPPIHLDILSRFCRIFSNQAISKSWFRIIWPWLLSWLSQNSFCFNVLTWRRRSCLLSTVSNLLRLVKWLWLPHYGSTSDTTRLH